MAVKYSAQCIHLLYIGLHLTCLKHIGQMRYVVATFWIDSDVSMAGNFFKSYQFGTKSDTEASKCIHVFGFCFSFFQ